MAQTIEVSIDNQGGILLPQVLKHRLGLLPGMTMVVEEDDEERVCLRVQTESPELVDKQGIIVVRTESSEDLTNEAIAKPSKRCHPREGGGPEILEKIGFPLSQK